MSYELIKSFSIREDGVYVAAESNNVYPKGFYSEKHPFFTKMLITKGESEVIKEILWNFVTGSFQPIGSNKTVRMCADIADSVRGNAEFKKQNNIYWCWDEKERSDEEKVLA
jgi:hypothetical protein